MAQNIFLSLIRHFPFFFAQNNCKKPREPLEHMIKLCLLLCLLQSGGPSPQRGRSLPSHYENQNQYNEMQSRREPPQPPSQNMNGSTLQSQTSNGTPPPGSYALYQSRPLPDTPASPQDGQRTPQWESSLERALSNKDDTPSSPAPPGYQEPPSYPGQHIPDMSEEDEHGSVHTAHGGPTASLLQ